VSSELYVGLMSGTSLDGVDAALVDFSGMAPRILASAHHPFDAALRDELLALNAAGGGELERAALCANALSRVYAAAVADVLAQASLRPSRLRAVGCHGQTVRHRPDAGYTIQLGNAALLAELCGARVVADFRSRDVAAGGQGAPLAPAFHAAIFGRKDEDRSVLNLGGIANLTWLPARGDVIGFDCGPGNCLMDRWAELHLGTPVDLDGAWASGARANPSLLERLMQDPYFALPPPKSTGRDLFNEPWLRARLPHAADPQAVQATLLELTARAAAEALARHCSGALRLIVCGGGVHNRALMARLRELLAPMPVDSSAEHGVDPLLVEAAAFAWLARQALGEKPSNLPSVTGARGARVLGAVYPP
jgi:anhydro-N-acetylmuramic acid kinase